MQLWDVAYLSLHRSIVSFLYIATLEIGHLFLSTLRAPASLPPLAPSAETIIFKSRPASWLLGAGTLHLRLSAETTTCVYCVSLSTTCITTIDCHCLLLCESELILSLSDYIKASMIWNITRDLKAKYRLLLVSGTSVLEIRLGSLP